MDGVHLKRHVVIHEVSQCFLVGDDAADLGCGQEHILGLFSREEILDILLAAEIQLLMGAGDDIGIALTLQFADDCRANHAAMTCDINLSILFHHNKIPSSDKLFDNALFQILGKVRLNVFFGTLDGDFLHVVVDHDLDELCKGGLGGVPAQFALGLAGVAPEVDNVGRAVEVGADLDNDLAGGLVDALLVHALADKFELDAHIVEGQLAELADGVLLTGGNDEILGRFVLQNQPHALDIILGIAPVAQAGQVAQIQLVLFSLGNAGGGQRDLAGDEGLAAALRLVVEENARAAEHVVSLAVLLDDPEAVLLGDSVGAVGVERGVLVLGHFLDLAVELGRGRLVDAAGVFQTAQAHSFQHAQHTGSIDVGGKLGHIEADLHVALGGEVVNFIGADLADDRENAHRIAEVAVLQVKVGVALQMGDTLAVIDGRTADDAVDIVALLKQKLCQIAAVLAGNAGDECFFHNFDPHLKREVEN